MLSLQDTPHIKRSSYRKWTTITVISLALLIIGLSLYYKPALSETASNAANPSYTYSTYKSSDDIELHVIKTKPERIQLQAIFNNVTAAGQYGINGGFFWQEQMLSIAVEDDQPVIGMPRQYGSGWYNAKYARGTLVYDRVAKKLSIQVVGSADELEVKDRTQYWAQGGVSMDLQHDHVWKKTTMDQGLPFPDDKRLRSGVVYDHEGNLYLIVTTTKCTAEQFRQAVQSYGAAGLHRLVDGIFLDGDGSSQLLLPEAALPGDGRPVMQMMSIVE